MDKHGPFIDDLPSKTVVMFHSVVKLLHGNGNDDNADNPKMVELNGMKCLP